MQHVSKQRRTLDVTALPPQVLACRDLPMCDFVGVARYRCGNIKWVGEEGGQSIGRKRMITFHRDTPSNLKIDAEISVSVSLHELRENIG